MTLPSGWTVTRLDGVVAERVTQGEPTADAVPYIDISAIDRERKCIAEAQTVTNSTAPTRARQWVKAGDVLVSMTRPNLNAVALVPDSLEGAVASTGFDVLRAIGVLPKWLYYRVRSRNFVQDVCKGVQGVVYPAIRPADVRRHELPVPPRAEQARIVEALESHLSRLDAAVGSLESAQRKLKAYRASALKAAVEGRLVPTEAELARTEGRSYERADVLLDRILKERRHRWEEAELAKMQAAGKLPKDDRWKAKYSEPEPPDVADLPSLPEGWCWATMPQLGEVNRGKSKHRPRNDPRLLGGRYPFVQTGDVRRADTWLRDFTATYSDFGLAQSRLWPAGTLCITIAANIAETAILTFDACFPDSVVGFVASEPVLVRYIEMFLRTAKQDLDRYAPATAQKNINLETLEGVAVPLPPLVEQGRMIEELDRILSIGSVVEESVAQQTLRSGRLRQAILSAAFEGKLVDQDPADESADVLLARLRQGSGQVRSNSETVHTGGQKAKRSRKLREAS